MSKGKGVIILTDMFGGTPSNLAISIMAEEKVEVVAGVNLPMLIKISSLRNNCEIKELIKISQEAGRKYMNVASAFFGDSDNCKKKLETKILITNKLGLHARASAKFVEFTSKCKSNFLVKKGKNIVNGSSLLGLMTLAASKGTEIKIQCTGQNAEEDLNKLVNLIKNNFGEEKPLPDNLVKEKFFKGIAVSHGFAIGNCAIKKSSNLSISKYNIPIHEVKNEIMRLDLAVKKTVTDLEKIIKKIKTNKSDIYKEMKFMLEANISIISSSSLVTDAKKKIKSDLINGEFAIIEELNKHSKIFKKSKMIILKKGLMM